ncbi:hypothetical protein [Streptomyces tailanensis]|uniref:hypothetical protein n=1 Tax=Streptomyces tailanensis TaxID=2569858 RepID=UPI00122DFE0F|nr:hypothetical protein [Streptomyces tailanensis]
MTDLIRSLTAWLSLLPKPRGRHRAAAFHPRPTFTAPPPPPCTPLPAHRSPYGLHEEFDGAATIAVRPYVTVHEQRQRRRELAMATMGLDMPGSCWIHGVEVA